MTQVEFEGEASMKSGCRLTENGVEIYDEAKKEWEPIASAYEWVNKRTKPVKPNNKTMKYRVETDLLHSYDLNEQISEGEKDALLKGGCSESWFEPVEEVQEGQYWEWCSHIYRVGEAHSERESWVKDISTDKEMSLPLSELTTNGRKLSTDEIEQALVKEAKRRGIDVDSTITSGNLGYRPGKKKIENGFCKYRPITDALFIGGQCVYKQGEFAELVDQAPDIEINGNKVEFNDHPKVGCTTIKKEVFIEQAKTIARHGVRIHRKGEDITDQILAIASHYGYDTEFSNTIGETVQISGVLDNFTPNE